MNVVEDGDQIKASGDRIKAASQVVGTGGATAGTGAFGPNAWLVEDMYDRYLADPTSVSESWREFFADYRPRERLRHRAAPARRRWTSAPPAAPPSGAGRTSLPSDSAAAARSVPSLTGGTVRGALRPIGTKRRRLVRCRRSRRGHAAARGGGPHRGQHGGLAGRPHRHQRAGGSGQAARGQSHHHQQPALPDHRRQGQFHPSDRLRSGQGAHRRAGHERLLRRPTPTARGPRVWSDTVTWASGWRWTSRRATAAARCWCPASPTPTRWTSGGSSAPTRSWCARSTPTRSTPEDFAGTTVTLTNPGTLGTVQSVPRLMRRAGSHRRSRGTGRPAGFEAADPRTLADLGIGKTVTLTSTYDHRIIQGAESGLFLAYVSECLMGKHGFYGEVFESLDIPYEPVRMGAGRQCVRRRGRRRPPPPGQAGACADPHQHVPGARPSHRPPRSPGRRTARAPPRARPAPLRPDHLGPAPPVRGRRAGRQGHGHPGRDPAHAARRLLPDAGHRVHAHPGPRAEALDPTARRGGVHRPRARRTAPHPRSAECRRGLRAVPPFPLRRAEAVRAGRSRVGHRPARHHPRRGGATRVSTRR